MGKRSSFKRVARDYYPTPKEAVAPLKPFLRGVRSFAEPCAGNGALIDALSDVGIQCCFSCDIAPQREDIEERNIFSITQEDVEPCDVVITNPPWDRKILHPLIEHLTSLGKPVWLLFDADWPHTKQAIPHLVTCTDIVSVGRVKWFPESTQTGKDNCAWYRFDQFHSGQTRFYGRKESKEFEYV